MLRDWTRSDKVLSISVHAERFFVRLIMKADDYGCYYASATLLKADLFPLLLDNIREADLLRWMVECQKAGLIVLYESEGKKYLQILDFRQRLDKARSKFPLPDSNDFPEVVNDFPAEVETEVEVEKKNTGAPAAPRAPGDNAKSGKKKFVPPDLQQVVAYFQSTIGRADHPKHWPENKCRNQAELFIDHYRSNDWVQGRGKPIKDWQAACRNWIRRALQGVFDKPAPRAPGPPPAPPPSLPAGPPPLNNRQLELNYLYGCWLEDETRVTVISATAEHYNQLRKDFDIIFSVQKTEDVRILARVYMKAHDLEGPKQEIRLMKSYAVLEYFKQLKDKGKEFIYAN